jgi:hypothetical protein
MKAMKANIQSFIVVIACFYGAHSAICQTSPNGLVVSAEASLLTGTNESKLYLTVHLVNTANHEITILTKNLNWSFSGSTDRNGKAMWECSLGLSSSFTHDGHRVVPSLCDLSPVTLRSNEEAMITHELAQDRPLRPITEDSQIIVKYEISPEWASRFALWSGSVTTKPFNASVRKRR